eukprot:scaffold35068_cov120-Isochrysis_galbana.AAC.2
MYCARTDAPTWRYCTSPMAFFISAIRRSFPRAASCSGFIGSGRVPLAPSRAGGAVSTVRLLIAAALMVRYVALPAGAPAEWWEAA